MAAQDRNAAQNPLDEVSVPHPMSKKWIPYKHPSGIAVYYHQNVVEGHEFVGGEFMVSSIVKGSPEQCLATLMHRSSTTTILGPATAIDVLSSEGSTQVLHLRLLPPLAAGSWAGLCAPRHAVVKQTYGKDACGIHCLMFSSLPQQEALELLQSHQQQRQHSHHHHHHHSQQIRSQQRQQWPPRLFQHHCIAGIRQRMGITTSRSSSTNSTSSSDAWCLGSRLWSPVLVNVAGGYTISGLKGCEGQQSPESLVTCILKVDLGGWLSLRSSLRWLYRAAVAAGVVDALRDQLMTAVALVKDEVEQQRFESYPFALPHVLGTDALDNTTAALAQTATSHRASNGVDQQLQHGHHHHHHQQQQQQQDLQSMQDPSLSQPHHSSSSSHQCSWLAPSSLISFLSSLLGWTPSARDTGPPQQQQSCEAQDHLPVACQQSAQSIDSSSLSASLSQDMSVEVVPALAGTGLLHSVSDGSRSSISAAAVEAAGSDGYEKLVGLDEHGQPITGHCNPSFWSELHQPGGPAPFKVRGPRYLSDRVKVPAGPPAYKLLAVDLVSTPTAVHHIARYLPSVRRCRAASCFVINMMVPTSHDVMNLVMTFGSSNHWKYCGALNNNNSSSSGDTHNSSSSWCTNGNCNGFSEGSCSSGGSSSWSSGFQHVLQRFIHASDQERSSIFKMIPHIEVGPWVLKQTAGTTPVIMGRKLQTTYHLTHKYMEVDIDVTTCKTAGYIVQSIRGMTTSLVVDLSYLLEGQHPNELPEVLIGAVRFSNIDMSATTPLDTTREVPYWPQPWEPYSSSSKGSCSERAAPASAASYR